jgi:amidase
MDPAEPSTAALSSLSALSAQQAREAIATGALSPVELVRSCIAAIERVDPALNAMVVRADQRALHEAAQAEAAVRNGDELSPLHGLPVAIKDIQATAGIATTFGSADFEHNVPDEDAGIVARIRDAGGIVIGKTNVPELSIGANTVNRLFGATGNPFNVDLTCGGSSGGSAVAVAANMAPLATGSDHGGSLRIPASYCGVVGYRATPGVVPNEQRTTPHTNYSVQGPMARTVADCGLLLSVIAARSSRTRSDPMAFPLDASQFAMLEEMDPKRIRVAVSVDLGGVLVSDSIRRTFTERVAAITPLVDRCDWYDIDLRDAPDVDWHLRQDLFVSQWSASAADWEEGFNPNIRATYESALQTPMQDIARARRRQLELYRQFCGVFEDFDLLICPGVSVPPFPWRELNPAAIDGAAVENYMAWLALTSSLTVVGHPVVALPCGLDELGTPFGIQVVGPMYEDYRLLCAAQALEQAFKSDDRLSRPEPDLQTLADTESTCQTEGRKVQLS